MSAAAMYWAYCRKK